ncbi:MAG: 2-amino-4-hydroxy-6-hydroxymethyldihydropteridine diphosphokinase [Limimaricola sp.]|uniref:2-amino-4-hydroxy-6- hydroxymethyldihydropteridine diphosphokinase n=1 Tax=Limimaricola sp. TaxID=2211665 RepID=UPI001DF88914|nr:2-amino-4-hydroxy-6-hydroxymethyldihydropteridine diphosphokinase [Limimaricola sp.]MBI1418659.1 2-amino-4-hydroxy-6-hydroxymethyldihydropteridine diphosphokinase [Limimaricola sp.]
MPQGHQGTRNRAVALIALGANAASAEGGPEDTLRAAIAELAEATGETPTVSHLYRTPAFPPGAGPDFVNAALRLETTLAAPDLLALLHRIEAAHGRERKVRWGQRSLDLDLIALGDAVLPDVAGWRRWHDLDAAAQPVQAPDRLILPHPRLQDRAFVLVPLADVAPDWRHPVLGLSVAQMMAARPETERAEVVPLD